MQRYILPAVILLCIQIGLVAAVNLKDTEYEPYAPNTKVAAFEPGTIDTIRLKGDDEAVVLTKNDMNWLISESPAVLADGNRVETFLQTIAGLRRSLAVATSKSAAARFKVSEDAFAHHLILESGGEQVANLYLGTSPGFKQIHLRTADSGEIITVGLGSHELSAKVEQWIDKDLLKLSKEDIKKIAKDEYTLALESDQQWLMVGLDGQKSVEKEKIDTLLEKLSNLTVSGFSSDSQNEKKDGETDMTYGITLADTTKIDWQFFKRDENSYNVTRSDFDFTATVSKWQVDGITKAFEDVITPSPQEEQTDASAVKE